MRLCLLAFLFLTVNFFAQDGKSEMTQLRVVGKGEYRPDELIDRSRIDDNGKVCAAVLIESDLDGFYFQANNNIVKHNHLPGRDFLFVSPGERVIEINKSGYLPLKIILREYGIKLESGQTWALKITGDKKTELIPITINTIPAGATIFIDSVNKGRIKTATLKEGEHDLRIELEGFSPITAKISVSISSALFEYKLEQREPATVKIKSTPAGAKIYIDNAEKGLTPKTMFLFPGDYEMKLSLEGYFDALKKISISDSKDNTFNLSLIKNAGTLLLTVEPKTAVVEINKEIINLTNEISLSPGKYQVTVSNQGFYSVTEIIEVKLNENTARDIKLKEMTGTLQLSVSPDDADIEIVKGTTRNNWQGAKYLKNIAIGNYRITAKKVGFKKYSTTVNIEENKTVEVDINLEAFAANKSNDEGINVYDYADPSSTTISDNSSSVHGKFNIIAGYNSSTVASSSQDYINIVGGKGYFFGGYVNLPLIGNLSGNLGATYSKFGVKDSNSGWFESEYSFDFLQIPVLLTYTPNIEILRSRPYYSIGFYWGYCLKEVYTSDIWESTEYPGLLDNGLVGEFGIATNLFGGHVSTYLRYYLGLNKISSGHWDNLSGSVRILSVGVGYGF